MILATTKQRILYFIEKKNITKSVFYEKTDIKRGLLDKDKLDATVSDVYIAKILASFPDLNIEWLITGQGEMLKQPDAPTTHDTLQTTDPIVSYLERVIKEKDYKIEQQAQEIGRLREINENLEVDNQELRKVIVQLRSAEDASGVVAAS